MPTVTTTPTPLPPPVNVTFDFDDQVSALNKSVIQDGIAIAQHAFGNAGPIVVYGRTTLDGLMDAYYRREKVSASDPNALFNRRLFENGTDGMSMPRGTIYFYTGDRWLRMSRADQMRTAAHEYFHQIQFALSGRNSGEPVPGWLVEGSADYETFRVFAEDYQFHEFERVRDIRKDMTWGLHGPLSSLDAQDQMRAEDSAAAYTLGLVATEFLVKNYGEEAILEKFWKTRSMRTWQDAFRETFGITTLEFYNKFEEYRRANFPSYCNSSGNQTTLAIHLEHQLAPGSFHAFLMNHIPYVFCVTGTQVGTWTSAQKETSFKKPAGVTDAQINFCGGNCVVLAIRQDTLPGTYIFAVEAPDGKKAETAFQYTRPTPNQPTLTATPPATPKP